MTATVTSVDNASVRTRASLLEGLQAGDEKRWSDFARMYGPVVRGFALKAGCTQTEADEVVQETCIGVARNLGEYRYDPARCRFKTWLLNLAAWRIKNQLARRRRWEERVHASGELTDDTRTSALERVPDARTPALEALWDEEWRGLVLRAALEQVRTEFSATQFQAFDLNVLKGWKAGEVARALGMSVGSVYLAKHRVSAGLRRARVRVENELAGG